MVEHVGLSYDEAIDESIEESSPALSVDELGTDAVVLRVHYWIGSEGPLSNPVGVRPGGQISPRECRDRDQSRFTT